MNVIAPRLAISVGVVVERSMGAGRWAAVLWRPVSLLLGVPETAPWTKLSDDGDRATFYAGAAEVELYRSEAGNYRDNMAAETPLVWLALDQADADPPFAAPKVTVDPAEGEAWAGTVGTIVEALPMPEAMRDVVAGFVAEHLVEHAFSKRERDRADPEVLGRRGPRREGGTP